jgi:hypothetical protein
MAKVPQLWSWHLVSSGRFVEYLLPLYSGQASIMETIIAFVGMLRIFDRCIHEDGQNLMKNELQAHGEAIRRSLDDILNRLPLNLPSTYDCALALFLAVSFSTYPDRSSKKTSIVTIYSSLTIGNVSS